MCWKRSDQPWYCTFEERAALPMAGVPYVTHLTSGLACFESAAVCKSLSVDRLATAPPSDYKKNTPYYKGNYGWAKLSGTYTQLPS